MLPLPTNICVLDEQKWDVGAGLQQACRSLIRRMLPGLAGIVKRAANRHLLNRGRGPDAAVHC